MRNVLFLLKLLLFTMSAFSMFALSAGITSAQSCSATVAIEHFDCNRISNGQGGFKCEYLSDGTGSFACNQSTCQTNAVLCTSTDANKCAIKPDGTCPTNLEMCNTANCTSSGGGGTTEDCTSVPANNASGFSCSGSCTAGKECKKSGNTCKCLNADTGGGGGGGVSNCNGTLVCQAEAFCDASNEYLIIPRVQCGTNNQGEPQYDCCRCTATSPTAFSLSSPADGTNITDPSVTLSWNGVGSWGTGCPTNSNSYRLYVEAGDTTPDVLVATLGSTTTSYNYSPGVDLTYYWMVTATNGSASRSTTVSSFTTTSASQDAWWQVIDGDVSASGSVISPAPDGEFFNLDGPGGFPGVVSYLGTADFSQSSLDSGVVSSTGWLTESSYLSTGGKVYDSEYLRRLIPPDTVITTIESASVSGSYFESGGTLSDGYYWYRYDGGGVADLIISSAMNLGSRKVILLVDNADLYLNGSINLTDGSGFFMTVVGETAGGLKGDIVVDPLVGSSVGADLEGIYVADNEIMTGAGTSQLYFRGSVAAYGGIVLERDLTDNSVEAAEVFEYAPDLVFNYPSALNTRKIRWREVAP